MLKMIWLCPFICCSKCAAVPSLYMSTGHILLRNV